MFISIFQTELFIHISVNIIFKVHYMLIGKHIFVTFLSLFVMKSFRGACSSIEMLKMYMARESLGTPALSQKCIEALFMITSVTKCRLAWKKNSNRRGRNGGGSHCYLNIRRAVHLSMTWMTSRLFLQDRRRSHSVDTKSGRSLSLFAQTFSTRSRPKTSATESDRTVESLTLTIG